MVARMPLSFVQVERYRAFLRPVRLELRPLTLLFGYNSSGKSALLRTLPVLSHANAGGRDEPTEDPLRIAGSPSLFGGGWEELRSNMPGQTTDSMEWVIGWDEDPDGLDHGVREVQLKLRRVSDAERASTRLVVSELIGRASDGTPLIRADFAPERSVLESLYELTWGGERATVSLDFDGLTPLVDDGDVPAWCVPLGGVARRLRSIGGSVDWLAATRERPPRRSSRRSSPMGPFGEGAAEVLLREQNRPLREAVNEMAARVLEYRYEPREQDKEIVLEVEHVRRPGLRVHALDVGESVSQLLPVLVRLAVMKLGRPAADASRHSSRVVAIEHPEMHLHPRAEVELAKVIAETVVASAGGSGPAGPKLVVETHSENLLTALQLAIVKGDLAPEQTLVHLVRRNDDGESEASAIGFDERGIPQPDWPPGVLSEAVEFSREVVLKRREISRGRLLGRRRVRASLAPIHGTRLLLVRPRKAPPCARRTRRGALLGVVQSPLARSARRGRAGSRMEHRTKRTEPFRREHQR
jgi:hypothetical protein